MQSFAYIVQDKKGIHARPAGEITAVAKKYNANCYVIHDGKKFDLKKLLTFIGSELKCDDSIEVFASGSDEVDAINALKDSFQNNL